MEQGLVYISPLRYPAAKAGSQFSMKSCEAFADTGLTVELWAPGRRYREGADPFLFHHVKKNFTLRFIPTIDFVKNGGRLLFGLMSFFFAMGVCARAVAEGKKNFIFYSHEQFALLLLSLLGTTTFYEIHDFPKDTLLYRLLLRRVTGVVTTNQWKGDELVKKFGIPQKKVLVVPNAVDISMFDIQETQKQAREKLGLSQDKKIALYTGHLYSWKGVDTLIDAALLLSAEWEVIIVGGTGHDRKVYEEMIEKKNLHNVRLVGLKPHEEIPLWQRAADVLILPNTAKEDISKYYTSPVKLFEYMASRVPIVTSDIPSIRYVVGDDDVLFFEADNFQSLAQAIVRIGSNLEESQKRVDSAYTKVQGFSWEKRANTILAFLREPLE